MPLPAAEVVSADGLVDDGAYVMLEALLDYVAGVLEESGMGVDTSSIISGPVATLDFCGATATSECSSQLWVLLEFAGPSSEMDLENISPCANFELSYNVQIGVARCAPMAEGSADRPTEEATRAAARRQLADMGAVRRALQAISCGDMPVLGQDVRIAPLNWESLQTGDCLAGIWGILVL